MSSKEREKERLRHNNELCLAIGQVLRRVAGLPDEDGPFIERWDETHLPNLRLVASSIIVASYGPGVFGKKPRAVEGDLEKIRRKLKTLRERIVKIDGETRSAINRAGSAEHAALKDLPEDASEDEIISAVQSVDTVPRDQWTVPATLVAMELLEAAIVSVIERAIQASSQLPETGRPPNRAKQEVASIVGKYLHDVTGSLPLLVPDDTPEPWRAAESREPFAVALVEVFEILGFKPGIQRAGEYATSKL